MAIAFTVTPEPSHIPPRVRIDLDTGSAETFTAITVKRDSVAIRTQPPTGSTVSVGYDYEAPFEESQTWTVAGTITTVGAFDDTDTATLTAVDAWLIHPSIPDLSISLGNDATSSDGIYVVSDSGAKVSRGQKAETFSPVGSDYDIVVTNGNRRVGDTTLVLFAPTASDRTAINSIVTDQTPLLLRIPPSFGWDLADGWYSVGNVDDERHRDRVFANEHLFTLPLTPVKAPIVAQGAQWTCADVLVAYATCADVLAAFPTCLDALIGPP